MRSRLASVAVAAATAMMLGCGGAPNVPSAPPAPPLHLLPTSDLAQAAGLSWLVQVRPRDLFADPQMVQAIRWLFSDARFETFARRHGGIDVRELDELTIAGYPQVTLFLAHGLVDPAKVEGAFAARATKVDGRGIDRKADPLGTIVRTWGTVNGERQQLAIFGREAVGLEVGRFGPLRAAEFFAQERLKKASPALRVTPLDRAIPIVGNAPLTAFAPGPFTGEYERALGGMLRAATAVALSVRIAGPASPAPDAGRLAVRLALLGSFQNDDPSAAQRFAAAIHVISESALGRLCGLNDPVAGPDVHAEPDALVAELTISATSLFRGIQAATGASVDELMRY
ncbi:hypothetical protein [Pendulispora albinea]|uniref:Imelysin-like domain-containing protein n=1 Tax=Pendulispora albinea TaxID=2741071 RepID=A0ABZ2LMX1_9BACT